MKPLKSFHLELNIMQNHAEITYLLVYGVYFKFWRYRIELIDNVPIINDLFLFTEGIWQSEMMSKLVRLNKQYLAGSDERTQANRAYSNYRAALGRGEMQKAFNHLSDFPETHLVGNSIRLQKVNCAYAISDSLFFAVLERRTEINEQYLPRLSLFLPCRRLR